MKHRRNWFINRLYRERPIYRIKGKKEIEIRIIDEQHADYLYLCQQEAGIKYYDTSTQQKH